MKAVLEQLKEIESIRIAVFYKMAGTTLHELNTIEILDSELTPKKLEALLETVEIYYSVFYDLFTGNSESEHLLKTLFHMNLLNKIRDDKKSLRRCLKILKNIEDVLLLKQPQIPTIEISHIAAGSTVAPPTNENLATETGIIEHPLDPTPYESEESLAFSDLFDEEPLNEPLINSEDTKISENLTDWLKNPD